jgi:ABC-type transport system involved in multi-copper enzyme maturation permease subunit
MIALLKKDFRFYRPAIIGGTVLMAAPYLLLLISALFFDLSREAAPVANAFCGGAMSSLFLAIVMAAVFGGISLSQERREGWADFIAMLPISRSRLMASKFIISGTWLISAWALNVIILSVAQNAARSSPNWPQPVFFARNDPVFLVFTTALLTAFGLGWLLSTFLRSPTFSATIALTLVLSLMFWPEIWPSLGRRTLGDELYTILIATNLIVGALSLTAGCLYYRRRVEP